jgi:pimeloyl-ACP methyl ester carboxylesterase
MKRTFRRFFLAVLFFLSLIVSLLFPIVSAEAQMASGQALSAPAATPYSLRLADGRSVYFEVIKGQPGRPVYMTFNGLLYKQNYWNQFLTELNARGASIIRFSYSADPESLALTSPSGGTPFSLDGFADEVLAVLDALQMARVTLLPLSFGSIAIHFAALHPERVERIVMMAPMVMPTDKYDLQGETARTWLESIRAIWGEDVYNNQWSLLMETTVRRLVLEHVRAMTGYVPAAVGENRVLDGAIEKIKATRDFDLRNYAKLKLPRIDLILAKAENPNVLKDQLDFWSKLAPAAKGNFVLIRDAGHALVAEAPRGAAMSADVLVKADASPGHPFVSIEINKDGSLALTPTR